MIWIWLWGVSLVSWGQPAGPLLLPPAPIQSAPALTAPPLSGPDSAAPVLTPPAPPTSTSLPAVPAVTAQGTVVGSPLVPQSAPTLPALPSPVDDGGYWIISTRECKGELGPSQCSRFGVWRYDAHGRGVPARLTDFYASLQPQAPVCLMMHGSFVDWDTVHRDSLKTNHWIRSGAPGTPLHVVCFTWPSDDTPRIWLPVDVAVLGRRASRNGFYVAELISMIPDEHPICLVGHSHGARMAVSTLHLLGGGEIDGVRFGGGPYQRHRIRTVLAAAAFDHNWLNPGQLYERAVDRPEGVLNLVNRRDLALGFYPLHQPLATAAAVARSGFTRGDRFEIGEQSRKLIDYDITSHVRAGHIWPHYYGDAQLARAIAPYVFFQDPPQTAVARSQPASSPANVARGQSVAISKPTLRAVRQTESLNIPKWDVETRPQPR